MLNLKITLFFSQKTLSTFDTFDRSFWLKHKDRETHTFKILKLRETGIPTIQPISSSPV